MSCMCVGSWAIINHSYWHFLWSDVTTHVTVRAVRCVVMCDLCLFESSRMCVRSRLCVSKLACVSLDRCCAAGLMTWGVADFPLPIWILTLVPNRVWHSLSAWLVTGWALWQSKAGSGSLCISSGCYSTWMLSDWEEFPHWQTASANMLHEWLAEKTPTYKHGYTSQIHTHVLVQALSSLCEVCCELQKHLLASTTQSFQIQPHLTPQPPTHNPSPVWL